MRRGPVGLMVMTETDANCTTPPEVGFAIGRRVGPAVVRNRRRRQLRAIFSEVRRDQPGLVPSGRYLVSLAPTDASFDELQRCTRAGLAALEQDRARELTP